MNADSIREALLTGFGTSVSVRARRPGLFQVEIPSRLADGDAAQVYVREGEGDTVIVSDLGHTLQRLSYTQATTDAMTAAFAKLAKRQGFVVEDGSAQVVVPRAELLAAAFGLAQIETEAEATLVASATRGAHAARFKEVVRKAISEAFPLHSQFDFHASNDPNALYPLDAVIHGRRWLGIAIVANDTDAESAINTKVMIERWVERPRFAAITRDINALRDVSRKKLLQQYSSIIPSFEEDRERFAPRLADLAESA